MTLNSVIAIILCYLTEFDSFGGWLRHSGWRWTYNVCRIFSSTFGQIWLTQQSVSAIAELLVFYGSTRARTSKMRIRVFAPRTGHACSNTKKLNSEFGWEKLAILATFMTTRSTLHSHWFSDIGETENTPAVTEKTVCQTILVYSAHWPTTMRYINRHFT